VTHIAAVTAMMGCVPYPSTVSDSFAARMIEFAARMIEAASEAV
jgi:hypothetical protein